MSIDHCKIYIRRSVKVTSDVNANVGWLEADCAFEYTTFIIYYLLYQLDCILGLLNPLADCFTGVITEIVDGDILDVNNVRVSMVQCHLKKDWTRNTFLLLFQSINSLITNYFSKHWNHVKSCIRWTTHRRDSDNSII